MRIIKKVTKQELKDRLYNIDTGDLNLYKEANNENSIGIFQLNGNLAHEIIKKVKPQNFDEINAVSAFARPGTSSFVDKYIKNRENHKSQYPEKIAALLQETQSVVLYQEQAMSVFNKIGGFSLEECLTGDTIILTNKGDISIKEIVENKLDIKVLSLNEETGELEMKPVIKFFNNGTRELIEIEIEAGNAIKCTPEHEFYTKNRGWIEAKDLTEEDELFHNPS